MIKWIGQHIWEFISRFRSDIHVESSDMHFDHTAQDMVKIYKEGYVECTQRVIVKGNSSAAAYLSLAEDTDNGTNKVTITAPSAIASDYTLTLPADDGDADQFLQTDGSGTLSWAAASGGGVISDPYSATVIKVLPNQFVINDDAGRPLFVEDDTSNTLGVRCFSTTDEMYAWQKLPSGYKATHVQVHASATTSSAVTVRSYNYTTGADNNVSETTGDLGANIDITDIPAANGQDLVIKVAPASGSTIIFGATVTIATI